MAENKSQTQHITKLDFDVSAIEKQLEMIQEQVRKRSEAIAKLFGSATEGATGNIKKSYKKEINDISKATSKLGLSFQELGKSKKELEQILSTMGQISKITYKSSPDTGMLLGATATSITKDGKKLIETYQLQEEKVGKLKDGVQQYQYVWKQTSQQIINDIQAQQKAQQKADTERQKSMNMYARMFQEIEKQEQKAQQKIEKQEQQRQKAQQKADVERQKSMNMYTKMFQQIEKQEQQQQNKLKTTIALLDDMINKQKTFQALQSASTTPNQQAIGRSQEIQNNLQTLRDTIVTTQKVDESSLNYLATLKQQTVELNTQVKIQRKIDSERQKTSAMYASLFQQQEAEDNKSVKLINEMIKKQQEFQAGQRKFNYKSNALVADSKELEKHLQKLKQKISMQQSLTSAEKEELQVLQQQSNQILRSNSLLNGISGRGIISIAQQLTGVYGGIYAVQRGLRETLSTMKDVEFGVMEITRVFGDETLNVQKYTDSIFDVATEFGRSFDDVQDTVLRFAQANYSAEESIENAKIAMLALNTAELDSQQATQSLIAIMKQWGMESRDFEGVVDRINKTADSFAITSQDLVDGLLKASSVAKISNFSFEDTIGLLTAMKVSSGAAGKEVGNALKSIFSYIQRPNALKAFEEMGIEVFADKATGTLLPMIEILQNMANKWNKAGDDAKEAMMDTLTAAGFLSEELAILTHAEEDYTNALNAYTVASDRANDAETRQQQTQAAGVYRKNYYTALMENFADVQKVVTNLQDADGYSMQENSKYMETLTAKYNQMIAALQSFAVSLGESGLMDLAKIIVDITAELVNLMNQGELTLPIITAIGSIIYSAFSDKGALIKDLVNNFKSMTTSLLTQRTATEGATVAQNAYNSVALQTIALNAGLTLGITAIITTLIKAVAQWKEHEEYMHQATEQYQKTMEAAQEQAQSQRDNIAVAQEYINMLKSTADSEGVSALSKESIISYQKKINDILGESVVSYDENTNKIKINTTAIDGKVASMEKQIKAQMQVEELDAAIRAQQQIQIQLDEKLIEREEKLAELKEKQQHSYYTHAEEWNLKQVEKDIAQLEQEMKKYEDRQVELEEATNNTIKALSEEDRELMNTYNSIQQEIQGITLLTEAIDRENQGLAMTQEQIDALLVIYPNLKENIEITSDGYRIQSSVLEELKNVSINSANSQIESERTKTQEVINQTEARINAIKQEMMAMQTLSTVRNGISSFDFSILVPAKELLEEKQKLDDAKKRVESLNTALNKIQNINVGSVPKSSYVGGGSGGSKGTSGGERASSSKNEKSALEIEIEEFEYLVSMGQKTKQQIAEFYQEIAKRAELSAEERKDIEKRLFDAIKDHIEEVLQIQLEADQKRLESLKELADQTQNSTNDMFSALKEYRDEMYAQYETDAENAKKEIEEKYSTELEYLEKTQQARKKDIEERDKERERERQKDEYERRRRELLEDISKASARSGREARLAEREARQKLADLERQQEEKEEDWDAEDEAERLEEIFEKQKAEIEEIKQRELAAVDEMFEANKAFVDEQVNNLLAQIQAIYANIKEQNGEFSKETLRQIQSQMETFTSLIGGMSDVYLHELTDPIDAVSEKLTTDLERISNAQIDLLSKRIEGIENEFNEANINMKAYAAAKAPDLYNQYLDYFITPMSNGLYEEFARANEIMLLSAQNNANNIFEAYRTNFIIPLTEEINRIDPILFPNTTYDLGSYAKNMNYSPVRMSSEISRTLANSNRALSSISYNNYNNHQQQKSVVVQGNLLNVTNQGQPFNEGKMSKRLLNEINNQFHLLP